MHMSLYKRYIIYKKYISKRRYCSYSFEDSWNFAILTFKRTYNKKCSICKFYKKKYEMGCRDYLVLINYAKHLTLYQLCSRNRNLNNTYKGKYTLESIKFIKSAK